MNRPGHAIVAFVLTSALVGCSTVGSSSNQPGDTGVVQQSNPSASAGSRAGADTGEGPPLVAVEVFAVPVTLNWDHDPQPDGVELQVYFFAAKPPLAQPVRHGLVTICAYDGQPDKETLATQRPLHRWRLTPATLTEHAHRGMVGVGYDLPLDWGHDVPRQNYVTITVQYRASRNAAPIDAAPVSIAVESHNAADKPGRG